MNPADARASEIPLARMRWRRAPGGHWRPPRTTGSEEWPTLSAMVNLRGKIRVALDERRLGESEDRRTLEMPVSSSCRADALTRALVCDRRRE